MDMVTQQHLCTDTTIKNQLTTGASPCSPNLLHRTVKFILKKGKNGYLETWCL